MTGRRPGRPRASCRLIATGGETTVITMDSESPAFATPPATRAEDGAVRGVGFELEFSGLTLDRAADAVRTALDATTASSNAAERVLSVDGLGDFTVEIDWDYLKRNASEAADGEDGADRQDGGDGPGGWLEALSDVAAMVVPVEVVCPPIPLDALDRLAPMVDALRAAGAVGTEDSLLAAYGVHINAQIPRLDAPTLSAYLRAFALLQWWLVEAHEVDISRKVSPYIGLYPEAYVRLLLTTPEPDLDRLSADYLEHNATRNRALDLLPLLAEIDAERVRDALDDPKIKARPAFHYRLPNCHIERPGWSLAESWNVWCEVERLAARPDDLRDLGAAFLDADRPLLGVGRSDWVARVDRWLSDRASA